MASEEGLAPFSPSPMAQSSETVRGTGGKLKRQFSRRQPTTPYSRPPQNQAQRRPWISRIVDPAYRMISGGANRILPYFFSNSASTGAIAAAPTEDQNQHQEDLAGDLHDDNESITPARNKRKSVTFEVGGTSGTANLNESDFKTGSHTRSQTALNDVVEISELEKLMEGKTFSRAETDRLIEILNSRATDLPDVKRDERDLEMCLREEAKKNMSTVDKRKEIIGGIGKDTTNSALWTTPTPLAKYTPFEGEGHIKGEPGLSPAELAKAYMGGGHTPSSSSHGFVTKDFLGGGILLGKSSVASPSKKSSACWPGVKSSDQYGFTTPQVQQESFGLQNLPRTPYSRSILPNSNSKLMHLQNDSSKRLSNLQSPSHSVQLSKGRDDGIFGPSRRSRQSATRSSMASPYSRPSTTTSRFENYAIKKSSEAGESSNNLSMSYGMANGSEVGTPTVPRHSSQIARTILDHLERTQPTPKNKTAELKLATSWRYPQSSKPVEQRSSDVLVKPNEDIHNPSSAALKPPTANAADTLNGIIKNTHAASNGIFRGTHAASSSDTTLQEKPKSSSQDVAKGFSYFSGGEPANIPKPPSQSQGNNKPVLPSLSVSKPSQRWAVPTSSNAAGFTFPVSSLDGATSSEPTTPSIMPFTTNTTPPSGGGKTIASHHDEATTKGEDDEIPQFSFDGNRERDEIRLVFSSACERKEINNDLDDIEFTFGSEEPERLSFSSGGSDGVRC